ncbi:hypothetical protein ACG9X2_10770 [Acinetobacter bereziniae]|uniref:hypothetical protein n=1 Tax=Acinetobacter bereziniae TaxID=106648 RepID=UPI003AF72D3B
MESDVKDALKEAWGSSIGFLSVLATLGAAYIASSLFNDWKDEQEHHNKLRLINLCFNSVHSYTKSINSIAYLISSSKIQAKKTLSLQPLVNDEVKLKLLDQLEQDMEKVFIKKLEVYEAAGELKKNLKRLYEYNKTEYKEIPQLDINLHYKFINIDNLLEIHLYANNVSLNEIINNYQEALNLIRLLKDFIDEKLVIFLDRKYSPNK